MGKEIERKFLVKGEFKPFATRSVRISQGYLSSDPNRTVRVRVKGDKGYVTIKGLSTSCGVSRSEWENPIPVGQAQEMLSICEDNIIDKTRYYVPFMGHTFEVDEFYGVNEGLVIAELELESEDELFEKPSWLGEEVTGDIRYYNSYLAKHSVSGKVTVLAFDADDTLWENEPLYREAEALWADVLKDYGTLESLCKELLKVEIKNMEELGYGAKAFTLSLIETAIKVSDGKVTASQIDEIAMIGRHIITNPATPLPHVREVLEDLQNSGKYRIILLTKGDLLDQQHKIRRSGLAKYFDHIEIISNKADEDYLDLFERLDISPSELLTIGNSFKSDIAPVLRLGGKGVYIPFRMMWEYEKVEEYDHDNLVRIASIRELPEVLKRWRA